MSAILPVAPASPPHRPQQNHGSQHSAALRHVALLDAPVSDSDTFRRQVIRQRTQELIRANLPTWTNAGFITIAISTASSAYQKYLATLTKDYSPDWIHRAHRGNARTLQAILRHRPHLRPLAQKIASGTPHSDREESATRVLRYLSRKNLLTEGEQECFTLHEMVRREAPRRERPPLSRSSLKRMDERRARDNFQFTDPLMHAIHQLQAATDDGVILRYIAYVEEDAPVQEQDCSLCEDLQPFHLHVLVMINDPQDSSTSRHPALLAKLRSYFHHLETKTSYNFTHGGTSSYDVSRQENYAKPIPVMPDNPKVPGLTNFAGVFARVDNWCGIPATIVPVPYSLVMPPPQKNWALPLAVYRGIPVPSQAS